MLDQPHERALLSTYADDRPAPRLCARLGWQRLVRGVLDGDSDFWGRDLRQAARGGVTVSDVAGTQCHARAGGRQPDVCPGVARRQVLQNPCPTSNGAPMNTRTIAIAALVIAVILVIIFVF